MTDWITKYLTLKLPIIPLCDRAHKYTSPEHNEMCKCAGKVPLIKGWEAHKITYRQDFLKWEEYYKKFNIGLPLGETSGYCGIDIDGEFGKNILFTISGGYIPDTWSFKTGNGERFIYKLPEGVKTKKYRVVGDGEHEECAFLCTGQQTVLPPSVHQNGTIYTWDTLYNPDTMECATAPEWLLAKIVEGYAPKKQMSEAFDFSSFYNAETEADRENTQASQTTTGTGTSDYELPKGLVISADDEKSQEIFAKMFKAPDPNVDFSDKLNGARAVFEAAQDAQKQSGLDLDRDILEGERDNVMTSIVGHYCATPAYRDAGIEVLYAKCQEHNLLHCKPPLPESSIRAKVDNFFAKEMFNLKNKLTVSNKKSVDNFQPSRLAYYTVEYLASQDVYLYYDNFSHLYYTCSKTKGPWHVNSDPAFINKCIRRVLLSEEYGNLKWDNIGKINEVRHAIEEFFADHTQPFGAFDLGEHAKELSEYIVMENGVLHWKERELRPWTPDYKTTLGFHITYDPEATCPNFLRYLKSWLPDEDTRSIIQEFMGYCLIPNTFLRKALFLYGGGKNGKSMFLEFLQVFFQGLYSSLSYDTLFSRFGPVHLHNKLVNIFDDTTVSFVKDTSILKNLIAGGRISAEFKGKDMFQFKNIARFIYSSQKTPKTADLTEAWFDRWFFVEFPNKFRPSGHMAAQIKRDLASELSGIFNWALEGLDRLSSLDSFSKSDATQDSLMKYREDNDNVILFLNTTCATILPDGYEEMLLEIQDLDRFELTKEEAALHTLFENVSATIPKKPEEYYKKHPGDFAKIGVSSLYDIYLLWARKWQCREVNKRTFVSRIEAIGLTKIQVKVNGRNMQGYKYLHLDKTSETYNELKLEIDSILSL